MRDGGLPLASPKSTIPSDASCIECWCTSRKEYPSRHRCRHCLHNNGHDPSSDEMKYKATICTERTAHMKIRNITQWYRSEAEGYVKVEDLGVASMEWLMCLMLQLDIWGPGWTGLKIMIQVVNQLAALPVDFIDHIVYGTLLRGESTRDRPGASDITSITMSLAASIH